MSEVTQATSAFVTSRDRVFNMYCLTEVLILVFIIGVYLPITGIYHCFLYPGKISMYLNLLFTNDIVLLTLACDIAPDAYMDKCGNRECISVLLLSGVSMEDTFHTCADIAFHRMWTHKKSGGTFEQSLRVHPVMNKFMSCAPSLARGCPKYNLSLLLS